MFTLVLIRHGESVWNKENRFTGWTDVDLSEQGMREAAAAGELLKNEGFVFDAAYTSVLRRAIRTLWMMLDPMDLMWIDVRHCWQLNERHYGGLQGLNKAEMARQYGEEQVHIWRRSYDIRPPLLEDSDPRYPLNDPRYSTVERTHIPRGECLKDTVERVLPLWHAEIAPAIRSGKRLIIAAHGNSLRALVKYLDRVSDIDIVSLNIPTGMPLVYELDDDLKPVSRRYLGDPDAVRRATEAVMKQGRTTP